MKISLTLSLFNVKFEYELLVLCATLKIACDEIFLLKRFQNGTKTQLDKQIYCQILGYLYFRYIARFDFGSS